MLVSCQLHCWWFKPCKMEKKYLHFFSRPSGTPNHAKSFFWDPPWVPYGVYINYGWSLIALKDETAVVKTFFDYLKRRHLVVRGGAAPPAPPRRCAGPWPLPRHLFSSPD